MAIRTAPIPNYSLEAIALLNLRVCVCACVRVCACARARTRITYLIYLLKNCWYLKLVSERKKKKRQDSLEAR